MNILDQFENLDNSLISRLTEAEKTQLRNAVKIEIIYDFVRSYFDRMDSDDHIVNYFKETGLFDVKVNEHDIDCILKSDVKLENFDFIDFASDLCEYENRFLNRLK